MTAEFHPITNRTRPSLLDPADAVRVESRAISYADMRQETVLRLRIENALLREQVERLTAQCDELVALVKKNGQLADDTMATLQTSESGRRSAERWTWFWFALFLVTLALAVIAAFLIWD